MSRYLRLCLWAAMNDEDFQHRQFFSPPKVVIHRRWYWIEVTLVYPSIDNPFPFRLYDEAGLVPEDYHHSGSPDDVPF